MARGSMLRAISVCLCLFFLFACPSAHAQTCVLTFTGQVCEQSYTCHNTCFAQDSACEDSCWKLSQDQWKACLLSCSNTLNTCYATPCSGPTPMPTTRPPTRCDFSPSCRAACGDVLNRCNARCQRCPPPPVECVEWSQNCQSICQSNDDFCRARSVVLCRDSPACLSRCNQQQQECYASCSIHVDPNQCQQDCFLANVEGCQLAIVPDAAVGTLNEIASHLIV
jgi:hypothetical protein